MVPAPVRSGNAGKRAAAPYSALLTPTAEPALRDVLTQINAFSATGGYS
jgi:hypothetical protein